MNDIDAADLKILRAIAELKVSYPNADKIVTRVTNITPVEMGARLGELEIKGFIKALKGTNAPGVSLPNGIYAAGLTDRGRLTVIKKNNPI